MDLSKKKDIAEKVQESCIQAARDGFTDASMRGLCDEGAMEAAIGAIQSLNLEEIISQAKETQ